MIIKDSDLYKLNDENTSDASVVSNLLIIVTKIVFKVYDIHF